MKLDLQRSRGLCVLIHPVQVCSSHSVLASWPHLWPCFIEVWTEKPPETSESCLWMSFFLFFSIIGTIEPGRGSVDRAQSRQMSVTVNTCPVVSNLSRLVMSLLNCRFLRRLPFNPLCSFSEFLSHETLVRPFLI